MEERPVTATNRRSKIDVLLQSFLVTSQYFSASIADFSLFSLLQFEV
jgi:hypothetical protein